MNILDIAIAKKLAGGGGGSGTNNYNDLSNLPKINDTTLSGNKSSSALGLQSEINSDSKLASDLVDDTNQDNKFVTSTEKNTWNAKQNAIDSDHKLSSDLVDDANKTNKFVTSTEKNTWNAKQNAIDSDHKLSSSLVSFSTAEAAALASGIDSTKVGQISANQTNILYTLNRTGKNCADIQNIYASFCLTGTQTSTNGQNGEVTISIDNATWSTYQFLGYVKPNTAYTLVTYVTNVTSNVNVFIKENATSDTNLISFTIQGNGTIVKTLTTGASEKIKLCFNLNNSGTAKSSSVTLRVMLVETTTYNMDSTYVPPALPNYDLTRLESEDRAGLVECVDGGAKNKINYNGSPWNSDLARLQTINANGTWSSNTFTMNGVTATINSDGTVTTSGTATGGSFIFTFVDLNSATSAYTGDILSGCPNGGDYSTKYAVYLADASGNTTIHTTSNGVAIPSTAVRYIRVLGRQGTNMNGLTFKPMICTKAAFGVSQKFVPYKTDTTKPWALLKSGDDLNDIVSAMEAKNVYVMFATGDTGVSNKPANGIFMVRTTNLGGGAAVQEVTMLTGNDRDKSYVRTFIDNNNWSTWKQTTNV